MAAEMVLDGLGHEPVDRTAHGGDDLQCIGAGHLGPSARSMVPTCPRIPRDASQEIPFFPDRMRHDCLPIFGCACGFD
jgi:hypothetical protein